LNLQLNSDEEEVADSAAAFLKAECPVARLHSPGSGKFGPAIRKQFAEFGWFGVGLPESVGGAGLTFVEEALLSRELGRALGPTNALPVTLAAHICSSQDDKMTIDLLAGQFGVACCIGDSLTETDGNIKGSSLIVNFDEADYSIAIVKDEAVVFSIKNSDIDIRPCLDKSVAMGTLRLNATPVVARVPAGSIISIGRLHVSAMLVGICETVTTMIVDYAKLRETFGRPIGSYQAVRHPCADMAVRTEAARAQLFYASVALSDGRSDAPEQVDAAKLLAGEAAILNVDANIQLHGGIATTDEHDAHLYMKRVQFLSRWFGSATVVAQQLLHAHVSHESRSVS